MANAKYNLVVTMDPIVIEGGNQAKAVAAAKFAKWVSKQAGRVISWFLNGEGNADGKFNTKNPAVKVSAQVLDEAGKVISTKVIDTYSVAAKDAEVTFKKKVDAAPSETFNLDEFLAKQG